MSAPVAPSVRGMAGSWELNFNTLKWIPHLSTSINRSMVAWKSSLLKTTRTNMLSIDTNDTIHRGPSFWSRLIHLASLFSEFIRPTSSYYTLQLQVLTMPKKHLQQGQIQRRQPAESYSKCCGNPGVGEFSYTKLRFSGFFGDSWLADSSTKLLFGGDVSCHYNLPKIEGKKSWLNLQ